MRASATIISFSVKNEKLCKAAKYMKKKKGKLAVNNDTGTVTGHIDINEYGDYSIYWHPTKVIPGGRNITRWLVDAIAHAGYLSEDGYSYIDRHILDIEESIDSYEIISIRYEPEAFGDNYYYCEKYDGETVLTNGFTAITWDELFLGDNKNVRSIFDRYDKKMENYMPSNFLVGDVFTECNDEDFFLELLDKYGDKRESKKLAGDENLLLEEDIKELISEIGVYSVHPDDIDFKGLRVNINVYGNHQVLVTSDDFYCQNRIERQMKMHLFAKSSIELLGAKDNKGSAYRLADAVVVIRDIKDYSEHALVYGALDYFHINDWEGDPKYHVDNILTPEESDIGKKATFKKYLENEINCIRSANLYKMNMKKPRPPIMVLWEDEFFELLSKLNRSDEFVKERQTIVDEMLSHEPYSWRIEKIRGAVIGGRNIIL